MLWEAGERKVDFENQAKRIEAIKKRDNSTILVAEQSKELVGFLFAMGGDAIRIKHSVYIVWEFQQITEDRYRNKGV